MPQQTKDYRPEVCLIANYLPDRQESMRRYSLMLERMLTSRGYSVRLIHPPAVFGRLAFPGTIGKWIRYIDKYLLAPPCLRWKIRGADLVHICDHTNSMYLRCAGKKPRLITCHDLIAVLAALGRYPEAKTGLTGRWLQRWILSGLKQAPCVICVSHQTEADFRELAGSSTAICRVIHNPLNRSYAPVSQDAIEATLSRYAVEPNAEYLLHVGGNAWYKNRLGTLKIFSELRKFSGFRRLRLMMAGEAFTPRLRDFIRAAQLGEWVTEAVRAGDQDLSALYTGARGLLFPSLAEGFGWPIIEAQACGCPVITSNRPPMTEVAGEAAVFIDPQQPEQAAQIIRDRWPQLAELREPGFKNIERFSEEKAAEAYSSVYQELLDANKQSLRSR